MGSTLHCTFDVDGSHVTEVFAKVPHKNQYAKIFPDARSVSLVRFWYGTEEGGGVRAQIAKWPIVSHSCGIHPRDVPAARAKFPDHVYNQHGQMVFLNPAHKRKCLRDIGMVDKLAFF